eukprot:6211059-Pleurochrysis_carterae.AAC.2
MSCAGPPPCVTSESMQSTSMPPLRTRSARPPGRAIGPENRRRTRCARAFGGTGAAADGRPGGCAPSSMLGLATGGASRWAGEDSEHVGSAHNAPRIGYPDTVGSRHVRSASEMHPDQCARIQSGLGHGNTRLDRVRATTEGHDRHDRRFRACEHFVGRDGTSARRAAGPVEHVDGMLHRIVPERDGRRGCCDVGASELHDRAYGAFSHSIQSVHVWWRRRGVDGFIGEQFRELARDEFPGVVGVNGAYRSDGRGAPGISARLQEIHGLEARVVVDEDEQIFVAATGRHERACNIRVNDAAGVAGRVFGVWVRQARCVGDGARVARTHGRSAEGGWRVRRDIRQGAKAIVAGVQPAMHVFSRQAGRHGVNVRGGFRGTDGHCPGLVDGAGGRATHCHALRHDLRVQLVESPVAVQAKCRSMT